MTDPDLTTSLPIIRDYGPAALPPETDGPRALHAPAALLRDLGRPPFGRDITTPLVDVTDALTPGARAVIRERSEAMRTLTEDTPTAAMVRAVRLSADLHLATDRAFRIGRAYERGAKVRTLIGKTLEDRERRARGIALEYLDDDDLPAVLRRELAVVVLAGFTGSDATPLLVAA